MSASTTEHNRLLQLAGAGWGLGARCGGGDGELFSAATAGGGAAAGALLGARDASTLSIDDAHFEVAARRA